MSKGKTKSNSEKRKQKNGSTPNRDSQLAVGGELRQFTGRGHSALTTNQSAALANNQTLLRANTRDPKLLEDFIRHEKITHFGRERIPEKIVHARAWILRSDRFLEEIHCQVSMAMKT